MFSRHSLTKSSLLHHWRSNLAIICGVAAATAVLSGALMVGDSMRGSLRDLTLDRIGKIDHLVVSDGFFRMELADELMQAKPGDISYEQVQPIIYFPGGTVENEGGQGRASGVTVIGTTPSFPDLDQSDIWPATGMPLGESVIVNQALADDLGITAAEVAGGSATVTLRIPKRGQLPSDSSLGKKEGLIESLVNLNVTSIVPATGLGRFGLHPTQADPLNLYLPIEILQDALARTVLKHKSSPRQANMLLVSDGDRATRFDRLQIALRPRLEDLGLILKRAKQTFTSDADANTEARSSETVFDYWSLSSERLVMNESVVEAIQSADVDAKPVFTYLANDLRIADGVSESGIPFSMIASIDFDKRFQPKSAITGQPIAPLKANEMVLNRWAAEDLNAKPGDTIAVTYFEPESTSESAQADGTGQVERTVNLKLVDVATVTEPIEGPTVRRRGKVTPAEYDQRPAVTNDPDLTPEVPGLTDAASIENWDLPFETAGKIRSQDDEYWELFRTTPKGFVSLETGQQLWDSRFGHVTSFRIPASIPMQEAEPRLRIASQLQQSKGSTGLEIVPIRERGLAASSGSTPFDALFLALSMFVIGAALILVVLLFRLAMQQRSAELGVLAAVGFGQRTVRRIFLTEMLCVAGIGAWLGVQLGVGYAALMVHGLTTWWVGAISRPFLQLQISPTSLIIGLLGGLTICAITILGSLRLIGQQSATSLLAGRIESKTVSRHQRPARRWLAAALFVIALGLSVWAARLAGEAQAGVFMGAGNLVLTALLLWVHQWLSRADGHGGADGPRQPTLPTVGALASRAARRNPLRSTLTIGLVAVASFLIVAVSSFRLSPNEAGTAGFDWIATTSQPIMKPIASDANQAATVFSVRHHNAEDASCNNLYQSTQPQVLGVPESFIASFDPGQPNATTPFAWGGTQAATEAQQANPWRLLSGEAHAGSAADPIPVLIDKNTANYSLKIFAPGTQFKTEYDSGETVHFVAVGFLANTILQGSLITSESNFVRAFPSAAGYQYFLGRDGARADDESAVAAANLEQEYGDYGFDARSATATLAGFMSVQNTYLSTFQTLGGLGLLLGTFGLAAVQIRSVLERRRELALMQAVGFGRQQLAKMILLESVWLLLTGLGIGLAAALFSTLPHWLLGAASIPWLELAIIFAAIITTGLQAATRASRALARLPLVQALRV